MSRLTLWTIVAGLLAPVTPTLAAGNANWTFMVYMAGDNNLDGLGMLDFAEMASVGSDDHLKIVVLFDRILDDGDTGSDWSDTRRGLVNKNDSPNEGWGESIGEANTGDPDTLIEFVDWARSNYPADHYALVLWDHGNGWWPATERRAAFLPRGVCYDDTDNGDGLSIKELASALNTITSASGTLDLIGFDACLMSMVEVAYELRAYGSVMVGATSVVVGYGWPYDDILGPLASNPSMSAAQIGRTVVDAYDASTQNLSASADPPTTMSAIDLSAIEPLAGKMSALTALLRAHYAAATSECRDAAREVMSAVDTAVIHERHTPASGIGYGLAIFFPNSAGEFQWLPYYNNSSVLAFPVATQWGEFLADYQSSMSGTWIARARADAQQCDGDYTSHVDIYHFCAKLGAVVIEDADNDGIADDQDNCPQTANASQTDTDQDGYGDACDDDSDNDGVADDDDRCPLDADKTEPGLCGCGVADTDTDGDGTADCKDRCPNDPAKVQPGYCGCGTPETDSDGDGTPDCVDPVNNSEQVAGWQNDPPVVPTCAAGSSLSLALVAGLLLLKPRGRRD